MDSIKLSMLDTVVQWKQFYTATYLTHHGEAGQVCGGINNLYYVSQEMTIQDKKGCVILVQGLVLCPLH